MGFHRLINQEDVYKHAHTGSYAPRVCTSVLFVFLAPRKREMERAGVHVICKALEEKEEEKDTTDVWTTAVTVDGCRVQFHAK